ncbi:MAG: hypothetical protein E7524_05935 [Ruminococcaceae bacterium]|nr:hypothetical protein [Oscillospiraceae bacterium]
MEMTTIELRKITASEGMVLTNGEAYSKEVYLGCNDNPDNWQEITEEEYKIIIEKLNFKSDI